VFSGDALDRLERSPISRIVVTDTIPVTRPSEKLVVLSTSRLFAQAIHRIHRSESISSLFHVPRQPESAGASQQN
jgi:ribose-phosphate pyrophosphokinase